MNAGCPPAFTGWPPTPQSLNTKPLGDQDLNVYDASFPLLPPPLLPHPAAIVYAPHLSYSPGPIAYVERLKKPPNPSARTHAAASTSKANLQPPSPLSLSDAEMMEDADATEEDADVYQPSPAQPKAPISTANRPSAARKASHSVIERRRRERINETLAKLVELVPGCKSALEAKDAKAARSRRRTKKTASVDASALNVGGLHKLDVLLATVDYIEELHARLAQGALPSPSESSAVASPQAVEVIKPPTTSATEDVKSAAASLLALASPVVQPVASPLVSPIRDIAI